MNVDLFLAYFPIISGMPKTTDEFIATITFILIVRVLPKWLFLFLVGSVATKYYGIDIFSFMTKG